MERKNPRLCKPGAGGASRIVTILCHAYQSTLVIREPPGLPTQPAGPDVPVHHLASVSGQPTVRGPHMIIVLLVRGLGEELWCRGDIKGQGEVVKVWVYVSVAQLTADATSRGVACAKGVAVLGDLLGCRCAAFQGAHLGAGAAESIYMTRGWGRLRMCCVVLQVLQDVSHADQGHMPQKIQAAVPQHILVHRGWERRGCTPVAPCIAAFRGQHKGHQRVLECVYEQVGTGLQP